MVSLTLHLLIKLIVRPCRSTQSLDPEALDGQNTLTLGTLVHFSL
jgi:hypothetical protein